MAAEIEKDVQQKALNGIAPAPPPDGPVLKVQAEEVTTGKVADESAPTETVGSKPAGTVDSSAQGDVKDTPKQPESAKEEPAVASAPVPEPVAAAPDSSNVAGGTSEKPVESAVATETEKPAEPPSATAPAQESVPAPAPAPVEKPLETTPLIDASEAAKPNGTTTNGTTNSIGEDVEMKDAPAPPVEVPAPAPAVETKEVETVAAGEKRKAEEEPPAEEAPPTKVPKLAEAPGSIETDAAPAPAPAPVVSEPPAENVAVPATSEAAPAPEPKKPGRPRKSTKEKVPVAPAGRTLRKTRSQGPVEV